MASSINIPYRCPNCGDSKKFVTLRELRAHLQTEHTFISDQPHKQINFDVSFDSGHSHKIPRHSSLLELYHADAMKLEEELRKSKEEEFNNKKHRSRSEMLMSSTVDMPYKKVAVDFPSKATFREYGHSSKLNKHLRSKKYPEAIKNTFQQSHLMLRYSSDEDVRDDSRPFENRRSSITEEKISRLLNKEAVDSRVYHSNSDIRSFQSTLFHQPEFQTTDDKHIMDTLSALSHDVLLERATQHAVANSLYTAHEVLSGIEQAAEEKIHHQQHVISGFAHEMKLKEKRLANVIHELESLRSQQHRSMEKVNFLKHKCDQENKHLHEQLKQKQMELDELNKQITETKQYVIKDRETEAHLPEQLSVNNTLDENKPAQDSVHSAYMPVTNNFQKVNNSENTRNSQENVTNDFQQDKLTLDEFFTKEELKTVTRRAQQLEKDRQNLLSEMQNLLETAAADNNKLRAELDDQKEQLNKVNFDLEQSKQEQAELLGETSALYHQADVSLSRLKVILKEREHQLMNLSGSLEQARGYQEKLAKERDECIKLAEEREAMYRSLLSANSSQVKSIKEVLESNLEEKLKLEKGLSELKKDLAAKDEKDQQMKDKVSHLTEELAEKEKIQAEMIQKVRRREDQLRKARHEMERMTVYLKSTAEKELKARSELETFILGLIDRAGKAETELQKLKSVPASSKNMSAKQGGTEPDNKAASRLVQSSLPHRSTDNSLQFHSTPKMAKHTTRASHPTFTDKHVISGNRSSATMENHNESVRHQGRTIQQTPQTNVSYQGLSTAMDSTFSSSSQPDRTHFVFENTPEVERIIRNVHKNANIKQSDALHPHKWHVKERRKAEPLSYFYQDSADLSLDDNGIMWEQASTYIPANVSKEVRDKYNPLLRQSTEQLNDDTDIDEDLTDYLDEKEHMFHEELEEAHKFKKLPDKINKVRVAALQQESLPLGENIVKLLASQEPESKISSARQTYNTNLYTHGSQRSKFNSEKASDKTWIEIKPDPQKLANDYSTTESSLTSPLHKAKAVQKRVEQLTFTKSELPRESSSSKQSDGFQVSNLDVESDFSSSSYVSLRHTINPSELQRTNSVLSSNNRNAISSCELETKDSIDMVHDGSRTGNLNIVSRKLCSTEIPVITNEENSKHSDKDLTFTQTTEGNAYCENDKFINKEPASALERDMKESLSYSAAENEEPVNVAEGSTTESLTSHKHNLAESLPCENLQDQELAKYTDAELKPAKELRARFTTHSDTLATSSEDDLLSDGTSQWSQSKRKESADASTDIDLEKLAMPGYLQKGFAVRKKQPNKKHTVHKKSKSKKSVRQLPSQDSISSEPEVLPSESNDTQRLAVRRMRVVLFRVFSYLDTRTLLGVARVSKEWCRVSKHPALWRHVLLADSSISSEFLITLSKWCTQTQSLSLKGLRGRGIVAEESAEDYQMAVRGSLEPGLEQFLSTCHNSITVLHISDCDSILTDKSLWLVSGYCRLLTTLTYHSGMYPITPQLMWALGGGCPGIVSLFVHPQQPSEKTNALNNKCLLLIGQFYPDIQELGLGGKEFDKDGLLSLVQSCQRIKSLHLDHCLAITADLALALCKVGLKQLHILTVSSTCVEAKAVQSFMDSCRQLKRIHIRANIQDCVADPSKKKDKETYKKMVKALEALKTKSGFGLVFTLETTPVD